ncbi:TipC family immunity protein [Streptococcus sp. DD13]|uniref:TipC family immunity protein n=1 Tax=Streptococcus sp. DD13 TaxID=1777881 RepID=UPI00079B9E38|nr:TipC family immunity protein [Streptococcus sp. DD13]KXT77309.1 hypothetical protein STRDD13_01557 [Streptococcus sp. DD13]
MKKRKFVFYSLLVVLFVSFSGFQYYKQQRIHNIFDEIYYEKSDYQNIEFLWRKSVLNNLNGIHITDNDSKDVYIHSVEYTASYLPRNIGKLGYQFYFSNYRAPEVFIFMRIKLPETKNTINVSYTYSVTNKKMERYMWYQDEKHVRYYLQSQVEAFLAEHGKTVEDIRKEADDVLRNKVLKDWTSIYSSRFSPNNWGDVTVKDSWRDDLSKN